MLNWRTLVKKEKEERAVHAIRSYLLVLRRKWENTQDKLQLIASNQSTHNTLFNVLLPTIGNLSSITRIKGQDNDNLRKLFAKNSCEIVIILHNITNKFHPLDLSMNKALTCVSENFNTWVAKEILTQLKKA